MLFSKVKTIKYTPVFHGNDRDENPAVIEFRILSAADMEEFLTAIGDDPKAADFFRAGFVSAEGVCTSDGEPIRDADDIISAPGFVGLVKECADKFIDLNDLGGDSKNESSPSTV